jgi:hypothetical protein
MERKEKEFYEAPSTKVFEVKHEGVICASGDTGLQDYNWNNISE